MKKPYQTPQITVHGNLAELTQQNNRGTFVDRLGGTRRTPRMPGGGMMDS